MFKLFGGHTPAVSFTAFATFILSRVLLNKSGGMTLYLKCHSFLRTIVARGEDLLSQQTHACADSVQDRSGENHKETSKRKADEDGNDKESKMKESCRGNRLDARDIEKTCKIFRVVGLVPRNC